MSQIRSDADLAVTLRIAISRLARRIRTERAAAPVLDKLSQS